MTSTAALTDLNEEPRLPDAAPARALLFGDTGRQAVRTLGLVMTRVRCALLSQLYRCAYQLL